LLRYLSLRPYDVRCAQDVAVRYQQAQCRGLDIHGFRDVPDQPAEHLLQIQAGGNLVRGGVQRPPIAAVVASALGSVHAFLLSFGRRDAIVGASIAYTIPSAVREYWVQDVRTNAVRPERRRLPVA